MNFDICAEPKAGLIRFLRSIHPEIVAVFLFGSHARGTASEQSDIDLVLITASGSSIVRECRLFEHSKLDLQICGLNLLPLVVRHARASGESILLIPLASSQCIYAADERAAEIQRVAISECARGPDPRPELVQLLRYQITNQIEDLEVISDSGERLFCATHLFQLVLELWMIEQRCWRFRGKWLARTLAEHANNEYELLRNALVSAISGEIEPLRIVADQMIARCGGRLGIGFRNETRLGMPSALTPPASAAASDSRS